MAVNENNKIKRKVRNAYIVSTISIALVLFLLGSVGYLIMGAISATDQLKESVAISVMLNDEISAETTEQIKTNLTKSSSIKDVRYITKEEAAADFKAYLGDDFESFLGTNPLPNAYEVTLNAQASQKDSIQALEKQIVKWDGVNEVVYQRNVIEQISSNINKFNTVLLLFGGALLLISLILLNNTIRVTIFSKRYIINTMKLVGATRWFIMKPFLSNSIMQGVYAGVISWIMLATMIMGLHEGLPEINFVSETIRLAAIFGSMMAGGIAISLIFTTFAVRKFLRMSSNNIHIY